MDTEYPNVTASPPSEPKRKTGEAIVLVILIVLSLWANFVLRDRQSNSASKAVAIVRETDLELADALAFLPESGTVSGPAWQKAEAGYRRALERKPDMPRALRSLSSVLFLQGKGDAATKVMRRKADLSADGRDAWYATQIAFGAKKRPSNAAEMDRMNRALDNKKLGWTRFVAREALAPTARDKRLIRAELSESISMRNSSSAVLAGFAVLVLIPLGFVALAWYHRNAHRYPPWQTTVPGGFLIACFGMFFLTMYLPTVAAGAFASDVIKNSSPVMKVAISLSLMLVGGGGALVLLHRAIRNSGIAETVIRWRVPLWPVWGIGGYLALVPILLASAAVAGLLQRLLPDVRTPMNPAADLAVGVSGWALILVVLLVCVVVPLLEEVLFRGLLFPALSRRYGVTGGMIVSSVVFAGLHPQLPFGFLPILAIGICLCYLYRASGSLLACVIAHGLNNGFAMVGSYLALSAIRL